MSTLNHRSWYFLLVLLMLPLAGSGVDIYSPSLPSLVEYFSSNMPTVKFTVGIYLLGLCIGQIVYGTASDFLGRRTTLLFSVSFFILVSFFLTTAVSVHQLLIYRVLQGFFAGGAAANARSIVTDVYSKEEIKRISSHMSSCWSLGPILAPMIGGYLEYYFNWRYSFYTLAGYACVILALTVMLPETNKAKRSFSIKRIASDYVHILKNAQYLGGLLCMAMGYTILIAYSIVLPFIVQHGIGSSSVVYGNATLFIGVSYLLGSVINRSLQRYFCIEKIIQYGMFSMLFFSLLFSVMRLLPLTLLSLYLPLLLLTISVGSIFPSCMSKCIATFPEKAGVASALAGAGSMFMTSIASALISYCHLHDALGLSLMFIGLSVLCLIVRWCFFVRPDEKLGLF